MAPRGRSPRTFRGSKADLIGEICVAILQARGAAPSSQICEAVGQVRPDLRTSPYAIGFILTKTEGVIKIRDKPSAIWNLEENRSPNLPAATQEKINHFLEV